MGRLFLAVGFLLVTVQYGGAAVPLKISWQARALQPGEVLLLKVELEQPALRVTGQAFGTQIHFYRADEPGTWQALVGIDLDLQAGDHLLEIVVAGDAGEQARETRMLTIQERSFPTRYLTLPEKYVNPPEPVQERIRAEAEELKAIFGTVSGDRLWQAFGRPVAGRVISAFGKRSVLNGQPRSVHSGVDLRAPLGTPLRAPAGGRVILAKELYFAGNSVIIDHGLGLYSLLAHLSGFRVKEGQLVQRGETIGYCGRSGRVEGPHLHWSVRLCGSRIDPMALLWLLSDLKKGNR